MAFPTSPGVATSEIDLTSSIPAVSTTTGATVGVFNWGPANTVVYVSNETDLLSKFTKPDDNTATSFISAANFLAYANDLRVIRAINSNTDDTASSAFNALSNTSHKVLIPNDDVYLESHYYSASANANVAFVSRYPGSIGNSLKVAICDKNDDFGTWAHKSYFDAAPNTTSYAFQTTGEYVEDELHVIVIDEDGKFTGTANTVLERFPSLSKASDAKTDDGSSLYYAEVIYRNSKYIHAFGHPQTTAEDKTNWGSALATMNTSNAFAVTSANSFSLVNGQDGTPRQADLQNAVDIFENKERYDISLVFSGDCLRSANSAIESSTSMNYFIGLANSRKDLVAFVSPPYANSVTSTQKATDITTFRNSLTSTSYAVMDSGWKYQYDKYNDKYRWIPLNADVAGLCARTDNERDPWFSPAGLNRGQIKNLVKLSFNPSQSERDTLYKAGVNPVVSFPGEGTVLFGDKTLQGRASAFDRINVRRLFIVLEKAISRAARSSLFEFNDEFTRAQFVALVEPFLRDVQGRRGIYDFRVVCDETNNTAQVIDSNQFVGDIYVKPARSANFIQLNFVSVRSGVSFDEIVGRF
jgi:Phage tail sheath protein subtilisin-like domain/Phage tail sheath C-terminal domain